SHRVGDAVAAGLVALTVGGASIARGVVAVVADLSVVDDVVAAGGERAVAAAGVGDSVGVGGAVVAGLPGRGVGDAVAAGLIALAVGGAAVACCRVAVVADLARGGV